MNTTAPVNYRLPLLATIASTLLVIALFVLFAFFTAAWTVRQVTTPSDEGGVGTVVISGLCGLASLALIGGAIYFSLALIKGVRDLTMPMVRLPGYVERKYTGMGRTGGFWVVVQPGERPVAPPTPRLATALTPTGSAPAAPRPAARTSRPAAPAPVGDGFGATLEEVARHTRSTTTAAPPPAPLPAPTQNPKSKPPTATSRIFRIDKSVYNALIEGEPVTVGHSRFLEHIYYVEHLEAGEPVQLRNTSLI